MDTGEVPAGTFKTCVVNQVILDVQTVAVQDINAQTRCIVNRVAVQNCAMRIIHHRDTGCACDAINIVIENLCVIAAVNNLDRIPAAVIDSVFSDSRRIAVLDFDAYAAAGHAVCLTCAKAANGDVVAVEHVNADLAAIDRVTGDGGERARVNKDTRAGDEAQCTHKVIRNLRAGAVHNMDTVFIHVIDSVTGNIQTDRVVNIDAFINIINCVAGNGRRSRTVFNDDTVDKSCHTVAIFCAGTADGQVIYVLCPDTNAFGITKQIVAGDLSVAAAYAQCC